MAVPVFLVLNPPGAVDAKGGLKDSVTATTVTPAGGVGETQFYGFNLQWTSVTAISVQPGTASLVSGATNYKSTRATAIAISIDASGAGGIDVGVKATNTWYYVWYIVNPTTSASSALLSLSASAPTLPTGYTLKRRVGSIRLNATSGGQVAKFVQKGNGPSKTFSWTDAYYQILAGGVQPTNTAISISAGASPQASAVSVRTSTVGSSIGEFKLYADPASNIETVYISRINLIDYNLAPLALFCTNGEIGYSISPDINLTIWIQSWTEEL